MESNSVGIKVFPSFSYRNPECTVSSTQSHFATSCKNFDSAWITGSSSSNVAPVKYAGLVRYRDVTVVAPITPIFLPARSKIVRGSKIVLCPRALHFSPGSQVTTGSEIRFADKNG